MKFDVRPPDSKARFRDLTGTQYGTFTVTRHLGFAKSYAVWECRCECGTTIQVRTNGLTRLTICQECRRQQREASRQLKGIYATLYNQIHSLDEPITSAWRDPFQFQRDLEATRPREAKNVWWTILRRNPAKPWGAKNFEWRYTGQTIVVQGKSVSIPQAAKILGISRQAMDLRLKQLGHDAGMLPRYAKSGPSATRDAWQHRLKYKRDAADAADAEIIQQIQKLFDEAERLIQQLSKRHKEVRSLVASGERMTWVARSQRRRLIATAVAKGAVVAEVATRFGVTETTVRAAVHEFSKPKRRTQAAVKKQAALRRS